MPAQRRFALVDLPSFERPGNHCVRFLGRRYRDIPIVVCVCRDRASHPSFDPLQRHDSPERCLKPQQLRETVGYEDRYQFPIYDRDGIFASHIDESIRALGIRVLKSAPRCSRPTGYHEGPAGAVFAASSRGIVCRSSRISPWLAASRIFRRRVPACDRVCRLQL
jgi:hypothetical protein